MTWQPIETAPESIRFPGEITVDLWITSKHGGQRRVTDCYLWNGAWFQTGSCAFQSNGWTPVSWKLPLALPGHEPEGAKDTGA